LDVKVRATFDSMLIAAKWSQIIASELNSRLLNLRVHNIYDLSSVSSVKVYLQDKAVLMIYVENIPVQIPKTWSTRTTPHRLRVSMPSHELRSHCRCSPISLRYKASQNSSDKASDGGLADWDGQNN